jgi:hypothetical protein
VTSAVLPLNMVDVMVSSMESSGGRDGSGGIWRPDLVEF